MTRLITEAKARECLAALNEQFKSYVDSGYKFTLHEPGFHADPWTISCEGIEEWTYRAFVGGFDEEVYHLAKDEVGVEQARRMAQKDGVPCPPGVYAEAVNHWCLALYYADEPAQTAGADTMTYAQFTAEHPVAGDEGSARIYSRALTSAPLSAAGKVYAVAHVLLTTGTPTRLTSSGPLTPLQALTLAAGLAGVGLYQQDTPTDDAAATVRNAVLGAFEEEAAAAAYALATVGLRNVPALPSWMPALLADHDEHDVCEHTLTRVSLALANTPPGVKWRHVEGLGFVVYKTVGVEPVNRK